MTTLAKTLFASIEARSQTWMDGWGMGDLIDFYGSGSMMFPFLHQSMGAIPAEEIGPGLLGIAQGVYKRNGVVAACMFTRLAIFSQARFALRRRVDGRPGELFSNQSLRLLEQPWPRASTSHLLTRLINDADLAGNGFMVRRDASGGPRLKRLRPDWISIVIGVDAEPGEVNDPEVDVWEDLDSEIVGYGYHPDGYNSSRKPIPLHPDEVAHFAPLPDPLANYRGMSWIEPIIREVQADNQATSHKSMFFKNAASPNFVVSLNIDDPTKFAEFIDAFNTQHKGVSNAYNTLFFGAGATPHKAGSTFREMDYKRTMAVGETRIAAAAGLSAVIARISEGLQGSALNAGNYNSARRMDADTTFRNLWSLACGSIAHLVDVPDDAELWYDDKDIPFLEEDAKDAAEINQILGNTMSTLVSIGGFRPDSVVDAIVSGDLTRLAHTGKLSVQLSPIDADELAAPDPNDDPGVVAVKVNAAGLLIRSGFKPEAALTAVGLDPIEHYGLLPVTLQSAAKVLADEPDPKFPAPDVDEEGAD